MKQVVRTKEAKPKVSKKKNNKVSDQRLPKMAKPTKGKRKHPKFGTSKLEQDFAKNFLDALRIKYTWQFEAKEIGRFFDYYLPDYQILLEIDGSYHHAYGLVREQMNPMQKKNHRVDGEKNAWAALHGIPLIRIWEHDIRQNPKGVMDMLRGKLYLRKAEVNKKEKMNERHVNKLDKEGKEDVI